MAFKKFTNSFYIEFLFLPLLARREARLEVVILPKVTARGQGSPQRGSNRLLSASSSSEKVFPGQSPDKYATLRKTGAWKPRPAIGVVNIRNRVPPAQPSSAKPGREQMRDELKPTDFRK